MHAFSAWVLRRTGKRRKKVANTQVAEKYQSTTEHVTADSGMAQTNGIHREITPVDTNIVPPGRVISTSMIRQGQNMEIDLEDGF